MNTQRTCPTSFTRQRKLSFKKLILLLMGLFRSGLKVEIDRFYKAISKNPQDFESISKSALSQARQKLRPEAFVVLNQIQLEDFYENAPSKKYWKNYRVIGIDGSTLCLPYSDELKAHFGLLDETSHKKIVMANIVMAYDVLNQLVVKAKITPYSEAENDTAADLANAFGANDILVFDRGFPSHWLVGLLQNHNIPFCMRLPSGWQVVKQLKNSPDNDIDWIAEFKAKDKGVDANYKNRKFHVASKIEGLRVVKILLKTGEEEFLLTNLTNRETFGIDDLQELYALRWITEENYKFFKHACNIEYFSSKTINGVEQDFYAKIFMVNLASIIGSQFDYDRRQKENRKNNKYNKKINRVQLLAKTKDFLIELFHKRNLKIILLQLEKLLSASYEIIRPNRHNTRGKIKRARWKFLQYKGL